MGRRISLEEFSATVAAIHEAVARPDDWSQPLATVIELLQASKGAIFTIQSGKLGAVTAIGHAPEAQRAYTEHYYAVDPTMAACLALPPNEAATVYERFPAAARAKGEYFDFARGIDIGDALAVGTPSAAGRRCILSLQRPVKAREFDGEAKRVMALLAPHIDIAHRVQRKLADATMAREALSGSLDRFADAAFIVDAEARIRHMNAAAERLLREDRRVRGACGKLSFAEPAVKAAFDAGVRTAAGAASRACWLALPPEGGRPAAEVVVSALREQHPLGAQASARHALVVVAQPRADAAGIAARMRQLYGLTPAEGRLVALLALGRTLDDIALANGVSATTLRSQLRSVCAKTGVSRQADVVRLALAGPPLADAAASAP